jgi:hypothetical protein
MNVKWHERHVLGKNSSLEARIAWHKEHRKQCACRPIPATVLAAMAEGSTKRAVKSKSVSKTVSSPSHTSPALDPRFARIVARFSKEPDVSYGGKGFGSSALKCDGKIFAMMSSQGKFVVKLSKPRVEQLVRARKGAYFDPGHGRLMKEWLEVAESGLWPELAQEAHGLARAKS